MTEVELAWLAGLLEGEGSFMFPPPSEPNTPRIVLVMTDRDVIDRVGRLTGINYVYISRRNCDRWKPSFKIQIKGARAIDLMRQLRPWMGERRGERIDAILKELGDLTPARRLSEAQAQAILARKGQSRARDVAAEYDLHIKTVEGIWNGKRWGHLQATPLPAMS